MTIKFLGLTAAAALIGLAGATSAHAAQRPAPASIASGQAFVAQVQQADWDDHYDWRRREWRREQAHRRAEWREEQWRREHWRYEHPYGYSYYGPYGYNYYYR